jgi:hypothetical protein
VRARLTLLVAIAAGVTLTSVGAAAPEAAKQRVAITVNGVSDGSLSGTFVFEPLRAGVLKRDSGAEQSVVVKERSLVRDGQSVKVVIWRSSAKGKHGTFAIRARIENVDAGNGASVGTGTWTFVHGTGQYARLRGGGRLGQVDLFSRDRTWSERREGFLTVP